MAVPGQSQRKVMQSQAGSGIRSASAAGAALQATPRLHLGGWQALEHGDTTSSLKEAFSFTPGSGACIQVAAAPHGAGSCRHTETDGGSTEPVFT